MTHDVFVSLLENDARALRAWKPDRGLSLVHFVGFLAERQVASILRTGRRSPWTEDPTPAEDLHDLNAQADTGPEPRIASRQMLEALLDRLRCALSPVGLKLFYALIVDKRPIEELAGEMKMTPAALYAWRYRLKKTVKQLGLELEGQSDGREPAAVSRE
jgi:RNA polymerase sigma-70 factor (ECF subfamily)